ncbi:AraC family transcriptional regulator [Nocardioides sp. Root151]|uniref:AraC family transcriptional regulator n=1 Tax=Nocardioides sp. Root151 TaxID=1736475 RepID=UPI0009E69490|nr:AraC family transcriptional regulator [Nocardioides sp. Root151]
MGSWKNATGRRGLPPDARRPATSTHAGILRPDQFARYADLSRPTPDPRLDPWIEHYWTVAWNLPTGTTYLSEVVPHPAVHVTVESGTTPHHGLEMPAALVHGVVTRRFSIPLSGEGRSFGIKFRPGGFGAWTGDDVGGWTDRVESLRAVFGAAADDLLRDVLGESSDAVRAEVMDAFLLERLPAPDPAYDRVIAIVAGLVADSSLVTVEQVAERFHVSVRTLQRLFRRYVGVGPKWVLRRHRLHDAVTLIDAGEYADLADLSARLGWFDQAHFTREFTDLVGVPPGEYADR